MANINLYTLYNNKLRKFGVNNSSRYQGAFVEAVNHSFATFNAEVFQADTLEYIRDYNDIISKRLNGFTSLTFDADSIATMSGREYWAVEYKLERLSSTNTFTDTISDDNSNVVINITDGDLSLVGDTLAFDAELPDADAIRILIVSNKSGNRVLVNNEDLATADEDGGISLYDVPDIDWVPDIEVVPSLTLGDSETTQAIGTVSGRVINNVSGWNLVSTAFYSSKTKLMEWLLNEGTGTTLEDVVASYDITSSGGTWITTYVEDSCALDQKYYPYFNATVEYFLQEGGEWAIEPDLPLEAKMERNIRKARSKYQDDSTYVGPLGSL